MHSVLFVSKLSLNAQFLTFDVF